MPDKRPARGRPRWYYLNDGCPVGPVDDAALLGLARGGVVSPATPVWKDGAADWVEARWVRGLFPPPAYRPRPTAPPDPPPAGTPSGGGGDPVTLRPEDLYAPASGRFYRPEDFETLYRRVVLVGVPLHAAAVLLGFVPGVAPAVGYALTLLLLCVAMSWFLYRAWDQIQDGGVRATPSGAVAGLYVPFYNLYWVWVAYAGLAEDLGRYAVRRGIRSEKPSVLVASWYCAIRVAYPTVGCVPGIGALLMVAEAVLFFLMVHQLSLASVAVAEWRLRAAALNPDAAVVVGLGWFTAVEDAGGPFHGGRRGGGR